MRPLGIVPRHGRGQTVPLDVMADWIAAAGTPRLAEALLRGVRAELPAAFCHVFLLPRDGPAQPVSGASLHGPAAMRAAQGYFAHGFARFDVNTRLLERRRGRARPAAVLTLQTVDEIDDADYRRICYDEPGVHSRASVLVGLPEHGHAAVNFYRTHAMPRFTAAELARLAALAGVLAGLVQTHLRLSEPVREAAPLGRLAAALTDRERHVIAGIVDGRTTKMIARDLGLAPSTVDTYRYRAFRRLGIRREKELFVLLRPAGPDASAAAAGREEPRAER